MYRNSLNGNELRNSIFEGAKSFGFENLSELWEAQERKALGISGLASAFVTLLTQQCESGYLGVLPGFSDRKELVDRD